MKINRKFFAISGVFIVLSAFTLFSLAGFADDQNGTYPRSPSIAWDSCSLSGPLNVGGSSNTSLVFGDPAVVYLDDGASSNINGTQYEYVFRNPSFYNDYHITFNNSLHSSSIETSMIFNTIQSSSQTTTISYSCSDLVLVGQQFFDYLNSLSWSLVPTGGSSSVSCSYSLSFKCNRVFPTYFNCDDFIDIDYTWILAELGHPSSQTFSFSGTRTSASNISFFPTNNYSASEFKNLINSFDSAEYIDLRTGATEQVTYERKGLNDRIAFSDVVLSFTFITSNATSLRFTLNQAYLDQEVGFFPLFGTAGFDQYVQYWGQQVNNLDFTSVVKATGSFFDMSIGPYGLTLGMLGMFGLGLVFVIILIKLFKGG